MASSLYANFAQQLLTAQFDWTAPAHPIGIALVTAADYTPDFASDQFLSAVPADGIVARADLTGLTAVAGIASAANITLPSVSGGEVDYIVVFEDTGSAGTSTLIACIEAGNGLPFTPVGSDIVITWDAVAGIFGL